jgi:hypothetical protein
MAMLYIDVSNESRYNDRHKNFSGQGMYLPNAVACISNEDGFSCGASFKGFCRVDEGISLVMRGLNEWYLMR